MRSVCFAQADLALDNCGCGTLGAALKVPLQLQLDTYISPKCAV